MFGIFGHQDHGLNVKSVSTNTAWPHRARLRGRAHCKGLEEKQQRLIFFILAFNFLFLFFFGLQLWQLFSFSCILEPFMRNGRPPTSHSMHSFLHQYTGSFKKPPLRRPHSVIGGTLGSFMAMPRNGSRLGKRQHTCTCAQTFAHLHTRKEVSSGRADGI